MLCYGGESRDLLQGLLPRKWWSPEKQGKLDQRHSYPANTSVANWHGTAFSKAPKQGLGALPSPNRCKLLSITSLLKFSLGLKVTLVTHDRRLLSLDLFNGNPRRKGEQMEKSLSLHGRVLVHNLWGCPLTRRCFWKDTAGPGDPWAPGDSRGPAGNSWRWQTSRLKWSWRFLWTKGLRFCLVMLFSVTSDI